LKSIGLRVQDHPLFGICQFADSFSLIYVVFDEVAKSVVAGIVDHLRSRVASMAAFSQAETIGPHFWVFSAFID